ncbi:MAG: VWA domain-containing protein [Pseudanabaena sp. M135S2SP2A07QC]|nr:VWA domain-containing protein [Pseudanabaena sp. M090S1SP2A07QC]MCA6504965.1 VWA domain-containing protein [Pseudanabaena sp. M172S2SP2A07QC]MCA6520030.1 VWA domain-containing protein [Pseudanabaena sp. M110S1SP2A07QC]MCA6522204.1 VWA domain-containing protein [Pseudanabaena sp. M051S1SP2A07QC]MCA6524798.1 VWA domain-containing protein [Pseudanabaena sp. M179S2SP2A07QC]MCA6528972.1 VWA domain-containing protein [Pseudanabaena sp. M125S2SP2A07QC]MCA6534805.1 VWA domain-containing protein [P
MLDKRDYTLIIDKSGSMSNTDRGTNKSRWEIVKESTLALARKCDQLDPDGITVYLFSGKFKRYDNVSVVKVEQIFQENDPMGGTNLTAVLQDAINQYFQHKQAGQAKAGETILVITDGEPDDRRSVFEVIIEATRRLSSDAELAISFIQVGSDASATDFLKALDDKLQSIGANFDIVDTITLNDMEDMTLSEVLLSAIND